MYSDEKTEFSPVIFWRYRININIVFLSLKALKILSRKRYRYISDKLITNHSYHTPKQTLKRNVITDIVSSWTRHIKRNSN